MGLGNIIDEFHDEYRLTNTGATKQTNLPTTLRYGPHESTTLMPVSKMARVYPSLRTPGPSDGLSDVLRWSLRPYRPQAHQAHLKILPKVARPTGTAIGPPSGILRPAYLELCLN